MLCIVLKKVEKVIRHGNSFQNSQNSIMVGYVKYIYIFKLTNYIKLINNG